MTFTMMMKILKHQIHGSELILSLKSSKIQYLQTSSGKLFKITYNDITRNRHLLMRNVTWPQFFKFELLIIDISYDWYSSTFNGCFRKLIQIQIPGDSVLFWNYGIRGSESRGLIEFKSFKLYCTFSCVCVRVLYGACVVCGANF